MLARLALLAVLASSVPFAAGCAAEAPADEERGATTSHVTSEEASLARLEDKVNNCRMLTASDREALGRLIPPLFSFSAEVYVYFRCSVQSGEVVSASASIEQRAGWSTDDGAYNETAMTAETSLNIPVRVVTASGSIAYERTLRTAGGVTYSGESTSVGVGVERNFVLAKASVSASVSTNSASVTGGVATPIEIPLEACGGANGSFGARISLSAERVESTIPAAISSRAQDLFAQDSDNRWVIQRLTARDPNGSAEDRAMCCRAQHTCEE